MSLITYDQSIHFHILTWHSAWWGESFVNELLRISEQAEKKLKVRQGSIMPDDSATDGDKGDSHIANGAAKVSAPEPIEEKEEKRPSTA